MAKVKIFTGYGTQVEERLNRFLDENKNKIEITNILQSCSSSFLYISIFYIES